MTINDQIQNEKLQYDINKEAAKISILTSGKVHKCEYLLVKKYYHLINEKMTNEDVISKNALNNDKAKNELKKN